MSRLRSDLSDAWRQLRAQPWTSLVILAILALGIGANTAIYSTVHGVLIQPLPYRGAGELVRLVLRNPADPQTDVYFSVREYQDLRAEAGLGRVVEYHSMFFNVVHDGEPDRVQVGVTAADFFDQLGVRALVGRTFVAGEDEAGAPPVLLLTERYWRRRLDADPRVVGRTMLMNGQTLTIVGVLPELPDYPDPNDVFIPASVCPFRMAEWVRQNRNARMLMLFTRLAPGETLAGARAQLRLQVERLRSEHADEYPAGQQLEADLVPVRREIVGRFGRVAWILGAVVALVLVIACANVANLALAKTLRREREIALRTALGAAPRQIVRQLLVESTLLAVLAGLVGVAVAWSVQGLLVRLVGRFTVRTETIALTPGVLLFALGLSLAVGLAFGMVPAVHALRRDPVAGLRDGARGSGGEGKHRSRRALVVLQLATSVVLLVATGLLVRSLGELERVDPGFRSDRILTLGLPLSFDKYAGTPEIIQFYRNLLPLLEQLPGVERVAAASNFPLNGPVQRPAIRIERQPLAPGAPEPTADARIVSADYFRTLSIPLLAGRFFTQDDDREVAPVALVNRAFAERYFQGQEAIGQRIAFASAEPTWREVVGVVENARSTGLERAAEPEFYVSNLQYMDFESTLLIRTTGPPMELVPEIRRTIRSLDPELPLTDVRPLAEVVRDSLAANRLTARLVAALGILAFVVAVAGLGAVMAFSVAERRRELGIRAALGAERRTLVAMVLREAGALGGLGLGLGLGLALAFGRVLESLLYGLGSADPWTLVAVSAGLVAAVLGAALVPARRAAAVDPILALKQP